MLGLTLILLVGTLWATGRWLAGARALGPGSYAARPWPAWKIELTSTAPLLRQVKGIETQIEIPLGKVTKRELPKSMEFYTCIFNLFNFCFFKWGIARTFNCLLLARPNYQFRTIDEITHLITRTRERELNPCANVESWSSTDVFERYQQSKRCIWGEAHYSRACGWRGSSFKAHAAEAYIDNVQIRTLRSYQGIRTLFGRIGTSLCRMSGEPINTYRVEGSFGLPIDRIQSLQGNKRSDASDDNQSPVRPDRGKEGPPQGWPDAMIQACLPLLRLGLGSVCLWRGYRNAMCRLGRGWRWRRIRSAIYLCCGMALLLIPGGW